MNRQLVCPICDRGFEASGPGRRVYCSRDCGKVAQARCEARRRRNHPDRVRAQVIASRKRHKATLSAANKAYSDRVGHDTFLRYHSSFDKQDASFARTFRTLLRDDSSFHPSSRFVVKRA